MAERVEAHSPAIPYHLFEIALKSLWHTSHVQFSDHVDLSKLRVDSFLPDYLKEMEDWKLLGSRTDGTKDEGIWPIIDGENGHARLLGYRDIYELIREILSIKNFERGRTTALVLGIPTPARIVENSLMNSSLRTKIKKVINLNDLQLNISLERANPRTGYFERVWRKTKHVKDSFFSSNRIS